jgi:photosystem II stability/assembly factor-like uncharacterized protein
MFRRSIILFVCLIALSHEVILAQWKVEVCPTKNNLNSISLTDKNSGWIVGSKGTILQRLNGSWTLLPALTSADLYSVCMIDKNNGWSVGSQGTILHYDGTKWDTVASPIKDDLFSVSFNDADNGIAVGAYGIILNYKNGTWTKLDNRFFGHLYSVSYKNDQSYIGGEWECVRMPVISIDKGNENVLHNIFSNSIYYLYGVCASGLKDLWAVGGGPGLVMHFDGQSWSESFNNTNVPKLLSVYVNDQNKGICAGNNGTIMTYSDGNWVVQDSPTKKALKGTAISDKVYYAVGDAGTIVTYDENIITSVKRTQDSQLNGVIHIYPNPCGSVANIIFPVESGFISNRIQITNLDGKTLYDKKVANGMSEMQLDVRNFDNGIYIINITSLNLKTRSSKFLITH